MKTATIHEIKQELQSVNASTLTALCLRLARFKKENKELLTYLLFEAHDEQAYIDGLKGMILEEFGSINDSNTYFIKKSLRKILRMIGKHIRYTGSKTAETEWLLYFCQQMKAHGFAERRSGLGVVFKKNEVLFNIYRQQLKKAGAALVQLHEDLKYDYQKQLDELVKETGFAR